MGDEVALTKMALLKRRVEIWSIFGDRVAVVVDGAAAMLKAQLSRSTDNSDGREDEEIPKRVAREYETSWDENTDNRDWQKKFAEHFLHAPIPPFTGAEPTISILPVWHCPRIELY